MTQPPASASEQVQPASDGTAVPPKPAAAMGKHVGRGALWMMASTILSKVVTSFAQLILGLVLAPEDFGLYGMAWGITRFLTICQDGGVRELLVQRGPGEYPTLRGRVFWLAMAFNSLVGVIILAAAPVLAFKVYDEPRLIALMWVMALAIPLGTPGSVLQAKLRLDLKFKATSAIVTFSSLLRQLSTVCLAMVGTGAMSFAVPAVLCAIFESVAAWWVCRDTPWADKPQLREWPGLIQSTKWLLFASVSLVLLDQGPLLVIKPVMNAAGNHAGVSATGNFFWAYQMTAQLSVLLSFNIYLVLAPALQRFANEPERLRDASVRALQGMMLVGAIASVLLGVVMDPLEGLLFSGKWAEATAAVFIFGLVFPFKIPQGVTQAIQVAKGRFKENAISLLLEGVLFTTAAGIGAWFAARSHDSAGSTAAQIAIYGAGAMAIGRVGVTLWVMARLGASKRRTIGVMAGPWLVAVIAALAAVGVDRAIGLKSAIAFTQEQSLKVLPAGKTLGKDESPYDTKFRMLIKSADDPTLTPLAKRMVSGLSGTKLTPAWQARVVQVIRMTLITAICSGLFAVLCRVIIPGALREALRAMPKGLGPKFGKLLLIKPD